MQTLWILTEERPKKSVIAKILNLYIHDYESQNSTILKEDLKIVPTFENGLFTFRYQVFLTQKFEFISDIFIKIVSGSSSFVDFLVYHQNTEPMEKSKNEIPIMAIEETKTSDDESRNTGVYQRASKFVFIKAFFPSVPLYMLYSDEGTHNFSKPSDTSIFGTNMLLTLGVKIVGKPDSMKWFHRFSSLDELIEYKSKMRKPPAGNVPIEIKRSNSKIQISGRLSKPASAGNIGHDPNIGALSLISASIRKLGWTKEIEITHHGVSQDYISHTRGKNKFLYICKILQISLKDIEIPSGISMPSAYWHYERKSEKVASILLHMVAINDGIRAIYQNHAGCERGYFKKINHEKIALPKKDRYGENLYIPDLILYSKYYGEIILVEGKQLHTLDNGVEELNNYSSIINDYIEPNYRPTAIHLVLSIFGGNETTIPHDSVLIYVSNNGRVILNRNAPIYIKEAFKKLGCKF